MLAWWVLWGLGAESVWAACVSLVRSVGPLLVVCWLDLAIVVPPLC